MFTQLLPLIALSTLLIPVPTRAVPGAAWIRRQQDAQSSLTLDPAVIATGLEQDGQGNATEPGQVRSLTSSNNFINFCLPFLDQGVVLTNGAQVVNGSCNQLPMGRIIALNQAPRCKFVFPKNGDESLVENQPFTVQLKILNLETGNFVNAQTNYYSAPQQVNGQGLLIGHSHIVIETLSSLQDTEPLDPNTFAFFKGLNDPADGNNILSTNVTAGLPAGVYRMCSINTAANHQPALVSNAQHGALDDCSYFTVNAAGANSTAAASDAGSSTTASVDAAQATDSTSSPTDTATDAPTATPSIDAAQATDPTSSSTATTTDAQAGAAQATDPTSSSTTTTTDAQADAAQATDSASSSTDTATHSTATTGSQDTSSGAPAPTQSGRNSDNSSSQASSDNTATSTA